MVTDIQRMKYWRPTTPKITWVIALTAALIGSFPFIIGLAILIRESGGPPSELASLAPGLARAALFTLKQASLSALIVVCFSPVFAIGLFYFPGRARRASVAMRTLSFCLPSIVVATGIVLAWGNNGSATRFFESLGISSPFSRVVYSPYAVVLANALMNLPFASLMVFRGFSEIPSVQLENAELLGLKPLSRWRYIVLPAIMPANVYFAGMTFLLSLGSFGALSILGGGPASQTLELAIYQSIYYDGNWQSAAIFSVAHTMLAGAASAIFIIPQYQWLNTYLSGHLKVSTSERSLLKFIGMPFGGKLFFTLSSVALDLFVAIPVIANLAYAANWIIEPVPASIASSALLLSSVWRSFTYAFPAAALSTISAFLVSRAFCRYKASHNPAHAITILGTSLASAIVPAMAAAFGILVIRSVSGNTPLGTEAIIVLHATMILPFLISVILPRYGRAISPYEQTRIMAGIPDLRWAAVIEWRVIGKTLAIALAIALALSMNETAIVSMLGDPASPALTTTMIQLMGHYRFGDSAIASCALIIVTTIPIWLTSRNEERTNEPA